MRLKKLKKTNICAIIVTYYPDSGFAERLHALLPQVGDVIVVDNSCKADNSNLLNKIALSEHVHLISNKTNLGIATALNIGIHWAKEKGYEWAITLDQDTYAKPQMVNTLIKILQMQADPSKIAVVGVNRVDAESNETVRMNKNKVSFIERKTVITSGSLTNLIAFDEIGPFRDEFFIDAVDHEYCLRARAKKFRILLALEPLMNHKVGETTRIINFMGIPFLRMFIYNHKPFREYFIFRNTFILILEYLFTRPVWSVTRTISLAGKMALSMIYKKNRRKRIKFILLGLWDGIRINTKRNVLLNNQKT